MQNDVHAICKNVSSTLSFSYGQRFKNWSSTCSPSAFPVSIQCVPSSSSLVMPPIPLTAFCLDFLSCVSISLPVPCYFVLQLTHSLCLSPICLLPSPYPLVMQNGSALSSNPLTTKLLHNRHSVHCEY